MFHSAISRRDFLAIVSTAGALAAIPACVTTVPGINHTSDTPEKPDRFATLARHNPHIRSVAPDSVLSVGNGNFAFNVDCTGLQSLPSVYNAAGDQPAIPLATLAHWAWHTTPRPADIDHAKFTYKPYNFHGRDVPYATSSTGQSALFDYLRENPHRLNLGRIGFVFDGREVTPDQLANIDQHLDLAAGIITSRFALAGNTVQVMTCAHPSSDAVAVRVNSSLVASGRLAIQIAFAYGSSGWSGDGGDWSPASRSLHETRLSEDSSATQVVLARTVDATRYSVRVNLAQSGGAHAKFEGTASPNSHLYQISAAPGQDVLEVSFVFDSMQPSDGTFPTFAETRAASEKAWHAFWSTGAAIDLSDCTDARAFELERRIVLSQYLTAIHCAGQYPSSETGLLCNSWYGKFHLEMHWWHAVHFSYWNRHQLFTRSLPLYSGMLDSARARAAFQGFKGARWPKMLGPDGADSPSSIGPLLIWQQPHPIYYAELCYRDNPTSATLRQWRDIVIETAEFMASYAYLDTARGAGGQYILGPCLRTVSENNDDTAINPTWELTAWRFGLETAQKWLERLGLPRRAQWDAILGKLAPAPVRDGLYMLHEGQDSFTPQWAWEHPAMLGALGVLPGNGIDPAIMAATVKRLRLTWDFSRIWGWDYPTAAMCAARTLQPELAVEFLTMEAPTNRYLPNGCNFQRAGNNPVPAYFPGNGGLLAAVALMTAGWQSGPTESQGPVPGFPKNRHWAIRAENFRPFL